MWGLQLSGVATNCSGQRHQMCLDPAPICAMQYINHPRVQSGEWSRKGSRKLRSEGATGKFWTLALLSRRDYGEQKGLQVVTVKYIRVGEELFVDYRVK